MRFRVSALVIALVCFLVASLAPAGSQVTRDELDEARQRRDQANARLDEVIGLYDHVYAELSTVTFRLGEFQERIDSYEDEINRLRSLIQEQAIAAYKSGSLQEFDLFFASDTVGDLITARELLERAAAREISMLDRLAAVRIGLDTTRERLLEDQAALRELEQQQAALVDEVGRLFDDLNTEYEELEAEFAEQERLRREEERRRRLAEIARLEGAAAGATAEQTSGFQCLFANTYRFVNDWGQARPGGRSHKGTDIAAPYGHPVLAVATGTVLRRNSELGGISLWLDADNGTSYYYAHLSGYADGVSEGARVTAGQVVAYNGDSGNAQGGVPHVHFQLHPGGRGNPPVNPYPTLAEHC
jgi:murein DD-endopeptidase MepM/ murein hydrolase activator NlpD